MLSALLAVAGVLAVTGGPAAAHAGGLTATDARGRVVSVLPAVPGLEITAIEDGARLRLRNGTTGPVTINPGGGTATPATIPPGAELTWIDTRSTPDGRSVAAGKTVSWTIPLDAAGTTVVVTGTLVGERRPAAPLWWLAAALTATATVLLSRRTRRADLLLATAGAVAATASIAHVIGSTLAVESAPPAGTFLSAAGINLLAWPLIIGGAVTTFRGRPAGVLAVCGGAALTAVFVLPDVTSFHRAVLPFEGPAVIERILVALALGLGAGVAVAGARVLGDLARKAAGDSGSPTGEPAGGPVAGSGSVAGSASVAVDGSAAESKSVAVSGSVAVDGSVAGSGSVAEDGSVAGSGSVAVDGSVAVSGSVAVDGSVAESGSAAARGSVAEDSAVAGSGSVAGAGGDVGVVSPEQSPTAGKA
ncbi:hypothetical protein [Actinoplanes xinjiangensis]|uniref:Uncharacterized protein n=1 Tax=Actinoplanes xinjiangensis TaxID=512350 RepID=A0A316FLB9_9ACTN|nr:hypothetical protein [Actinoplanes xinjiangensis]PWK48902.1 hypothetical protein BC793_105252 [Actinoplanes xinjiangensis]